MWQRRATKPETRSGKDNSASLSVDTKFESCRYEAQASAIRHLFIHALHIRIRSDKMAQISETAPRMWPNVEYLIQSALLNNPLTIQPSTLLIY
ncbi:hypothetical protein ACLKA6_003531 [Drosophila palustris]